jgi:hypothetical protein
MTANPTNLSACQIFQPQPVIVAVDEYFEHVILLKCERVAPTDWPALHVHMVGFLVLVYLLAGVSIVAPRVAILFESRVLEQELRARVPETNAKNPTAASTGGVFRNRQSTRLPGS